MGDYRARPQLLRELEANLQIPGQLERKILFFLTGVMSTWTEVRPLRLCRKRQSHRMGTHGHHKGGPHTPGEKHRTLPHTQSRNSSCPLACAEV